MVVIADPQLTDRTSYKDVIQAHNSGGTTIGRFKLAFYTTFCDGYLRRVWGALLAVGKPPWALTVFLGDMFDGGRYVEHQANWDQLTARFNQTFHGALSAEHGPLIVNLGNHDSNTCSLCSARTMYRHGLPKAIEEFADLRSHNGLLQNYPQVENFDQRTLQRHVDTFGPINRVTWSLASLAVDLPSCLAIDVTRC